MGHDISASTHKQPISHYNNTLKKIPFQDNKNVKKRHILATHFQEDILKYDF